MTHPLLVRITHWINAACMVCMVMSGWGIYNASPLFGFRFPAWATLGGWLGASIAWHLAVMWLLVGNGLLYGLYGLLAGHFRRRLLPLRPGEVLADIGAALRLRLAHSSGVYNAVQRATYLGVLLLGVLVLASGLALWKPVQLDELAGLLGGYEAARRVHFLAMAGIAGFTLLHLVMVVLVPRTLPGMIIGRPLPEKAS
ncbi:cytochrome b/b6 domain-containing protein [Muricoccus vinaceus]|uniref:Cytochrome b/b6 domain-containing protein n=1 Tax=Muricoccus vinaceus TaxID=424704 RepID=A0ABV6IVG0_9PROT